MHPEKRRSRNAQQEADGRSPFQPASAEMLSTTMLGNMDGVCNSMPGWNPREIWCDPYPERVWEHCPLH